MNKVITILFVFIFTVPLVYADELTEERLAEIYEKVEVESKRLEEISVKQDALKKELTKQRKLIKNLRDDESSLLADLEKINLAAKSTAERIQGISDEISTLKQLALKRLKVLYMNRSQSLVDNFLASAQGHSFTQSVYFISKIHAHDEKLVTRMLSLKQENEVKQTEIKELVRNKNNVYKKIQSKRKVLQGQIEKQKKLISESEHQKEKMSEVITALRAQALRLETVVVSLTSEEDPSLARTSRLKATDSSKAKQSAQSEGYDGKGLFRQKGALALPAEGKLIQPYGKSKKSGVSAMVFNKGLEFRIPIGAEIKAIADAKVLFKGRMPIYGIVIILDHGERYYSLYGRVAQTQVEVGDIVEKSEVIAFAGESEEEASNLYFEIRRNGAPVNPQNYYNKKFS